MTFNPNSDRHVNRLNQAMQASRKHLLPFRENRDRMIKQFVGDMHGLGGASHDVIANLFQQQAVVTVQRLSGGEPRFNISTQQRELWPFAHRYKQALNTLVQEIHLKKTIQQGVMDAQFTAGFCKVYLKDSARIELEPDVWMDPGTPFVSPISFRNMVFDTFADHWDRMAYCGDAYRVDVELVRESEDFDPQVRKEILPSSKYATAGDDDAPAPLITGGGDVDHDEINDMVDLIDLYFPRENLVVTWQLRRASRWTVEGQPLAIRQWDGPERGPYHRLGFVDVPDSVMPAAPGQSMLHLHNLVNSLLRKLANQAKRQKDILTFGGNPDDARRIKKGVDGEILRVDDPKEIQLMKFGGIDPSNGQFSQQLIDLYDRMGGNLMARAGLGTSADTLGQEQMIGQEIRENEASMMEAVQEYTRGIGEDLGLMLWNDPLMQRPADFKIPGTDVRVDMGWTPEMREGDVWQYNFKLEPYSLQFTSPRQRVNSVMQLISQLFIPMSQGLAEQGGRIDFSELTKQLGEMLELPWLEEVIKFDQPPITERPGTAERPLQSPNTTRTNIRLNIPTGGTSQSRSMTSQLAWSQLAGANPDQQAAMGRSVA